MNVGSRTSAAEERVDTRGSGVRDVLDAKERGDPDSGRQLNCISMN